ncbi:MAG: glycosyltransferase, partial [Sediminibacterium sp.]|nr:glycosyltransferase [Sediminibacterium sp.]
MELAQKGIRQTIYVPVRSAAEIGKYDIVDIPNITLIYAHILQKKHRFLYYTKIKAIYKDLVKKVDSEEIDLIHAHFLFSDGGVALKLKQNFGIPFVTAVRNTDINIFFKYMFHLRKFGQQIMSAANEVL